MKNITIMFALLGLLFTFSSCDKKDDAPEVDLCQNIDCNDGLCVDGDCLCDIGYSGEFCENFDPCFGVSCFNDGVCNNGVCDCPEEYTGTNCQTFIYPDSLRIHRIEVNYYYNCNLNYPDFGFFGLRYLIQSQEYLEIDGLEIDFNNGDKVHEFITPVVVPFSTTDVTQIQFYPSTGFNPCSEFIHNPIIDSAIPFTKVNNSIYKIRVNQSDNDAWIEQGEFVLEIFFETIYN